VKASYIIAVLVSIFGFYLLFFSVADHEYIELVGISLHTRIAKGIGLISLLVGTIAFMVAYGSSLPPRQVERHQ